MEDNAAMPSKVLRENYTELKIGYQARLSIKLERKIKVFSEFRESIFLVKTTTAKQTNNCLRMYSSKIGRSPRQRMMGTQEEMGLA